MPKLIVSIDGVVVKEVQLTKDRSTIGRRPYNDLVIDNLAVSGEHAVIQMAGGSATLEDLGSTNGTYVNGKSVKQHALADEDVIEVGKYKLKFLDRDVLSTPVPLSVTPSGSMPMGMDSSLMTGPSDHQARGPRVRVLSGSAVGREMELTKVVTTIGKPGVAVAAITRRPHGFVLAHVEGAVRPMVNGTAIGEEVVQLHNGDTVELAGTRMQFMHA